MNDKLFKVRMSSLAHYDNEIMHLNSALDVTQQTRADLIKSFIEFNPYSVGDVIAFGTQIAKISSIGDVVWKSWDPSTLQIECKVQFPKEQGGWAEYQRDFSIPFNKIGENYKILIPAEKPVEHEI